MDNELIYINNLTVDILYFIVDAFSIRVEGLGQSDNFTGRTIYCKCVRSGQLIVGDWSLTSGSQYATINENGRVDINPGVQSKEITISCRVGQKVQTKTLTVTYDNQFMIEGSETMSGSGGAVIARYNQEVVTPVWSITSGGSFATIDANGALTFSQSGDIAIEAIYNGYVATKDIHVEYIANSTTRTIVDDDGSITTITETTTQNQDGSTTFDTVTFQ